MDHGVFAPSPAFGTFSDAILDLNSMGQLYFQGSWLGTTDMFNNLDLAPCKSSFLSDPTHCLTINLDHQSFLDETENFLENPPKDYSDEEEIVVEAISSVVPSEIFPADGGESDRIGWTAPFSVKDRMVQAMEYLREYVKERDVLIQIWVPVKRGGECVLTSVDQPFSLNPNCKSLARYRDVSESFHFPAEEGSTESAGLPGRVFLGKLPEWSPDVRFFRNDECPRKDYAELYHVSGCLALPVFERGSEICLAVVEVVTTTQKISCHLELENVCKALEIVDLSSAQDLCLPRVRACNMFYEPAIPEISEILQSVCKAYRLPLALTWASCIRPGESGHQQLAEKHACCISTVDSACFLADKDLFGFSMACSEQCLSLDQGIVGRAFTTKKQRFATDVTSFSKTNYPLSHHARIFGLRAAIAIPLRSIYSGSVELVLELFLPKDCLDTDEQKRMWHILPIVIQQVCRSADVIMDIGLDEESSQPKIASSEGRPDKGSQKFTEDSFWIPHMMEDQKDNFVYVSWDCPKEEPKEEFQVGFCETNKMALDNKQIILEFGKLQQNSPSRIIFEGGGDSYTGQRHSLGPRGAGKKRQTKTEKTVSLQVLQQYFAANLKDAAKSVGVCPTTLKRICRQYGITRWPSRKLKKVSHSLRKLQLEVDSVHGTKGLIQISSLYTSFPELNSAKQSHDSEPFPSFKMDDNAMELNQQPGTGLFIPKDNDRSPSSSSDHNSGSSICQFPGAKQPANAMNADDHGAVLKSSNSEDTLNQKEKMLFANKTSDEHQSMKTPPSSQDASAIRIKATFGEQNVRFRLQLDWGFRDLQKELGKRFNIDDFSRIDLKYLDNDGESVLLTCDADLEECKDLLSFSSQGQTIKITIHQASKMNQLGSL